MLDLGTVYYRGNPDMEANRMTEMEKHLLAQLTARQETPLERLQRELRELAAKHAAHATTGA